MSTAFLKTLVEQGHPAEARVAMAFYLGGWTVSPRNDGSLLDLVGEPPGGLPWWLEVKNEDNQAQTGNLCIELHQGIPPRWSGLQVTESHVWVHTLGENVAAYRVKHMKPFIRQGWADWRHIDEFRGADNHNGGILVPIDAADGKGWFDVCPLDQLPNSHVFTFAATPKPLFTET